MKIPTDAVSREALYHELSEQCVVSRSDRIAKYEQLRCYYLFGCSTADNPAIFNKILPQVDLLVSFLFAAETTRFGIEIGESAKSQVELAKVSPLAQALNTAWHLSNADIQTIQCIQWALVYNTMFLKLVQRGRRTYPYIVDPHSFGVLDESMQFLDDQEAFVHTYTMDRSALDRLLADHPKRSQIMGTVSTSLKQQDHDLPAGVSRIIMSSFPMGSGGPSGPGQLTSPYSLIDAYRAKTANERVEMRELWVWDDEKNDYHIATMADGGVCVYDRMNFFLPGEHPFIQFCPNPSYDYFWGQSEVDRLTQLQDARETRMEQIMELLNRQVKPPSSLRGQWQGIVDETNYAAQVFGASLASTDPTAEIKTFAPTVPQDTFAEIRAYDEMFNEMMGLSNVVQGKGESGVRSKGHAAELARLGSSRIKKRAFTIEDSLDKVGTLYLKLMQQHDPSKMKYKAGEKDHDFTAEQFTKDFVVKVDGHSSSPIFTEDQRGLAFEMLEAHMIDRTEAISMIAPPGQQLLLEGLKKIEAAEAAQAKAEQEAEAKGGLKAVK